MSFIPSRDVFDMPQDELDQLERLYDEIEEEFTADYVRDEFRPDATVQDWIDHYGSHPCPSLGAWSMLVYLHGKGLLKM
ncbi:hypothetical protein PP459_gp096 [Streptomyces phage Wakanda]|uniref:Uncharacterized protein n=2 Tax=Wakandavirus TaxID=3044854 RepID=A0A6G8R3D5_9CAUD|nr:hypothetical protein PP459_gp096 [Streptomyces phage Wakanda]YP_010652458.1 hypothetical protein PP460_gp100 [Streptomyces phage Muntaha]QIN94137.1 hypothetical protein SEA_WAKANDA_175 [Streptomyces phage Wakanda]QIN94702.1 hypothetical protein SEA_MUNTAHA_177 [Streptomyces phage Muntaha]